MAVNDLYTLATYDPQRNIGYLVHRLRTAMHDGLEQEFSNDGQLASLELTSAQFIAMSIVARGEAQSASDLCKLMPHATGAMTRMIDRLEANGLIRRTRRPGDRRLIVLQLTDRGELSLARMRELSRTLQNQFLRGFTRSEVRRLEHFLTQMLGKG